MGAYQRYLELLARVEACELRCGRPVGSLKILPVSKGHTSATIQSALGEGVPRRLGENYLEELEAKAPLFPDVDWHYLGKLQSRKIPDLARMTTFIHTVSRIKELEILSTQPRIPCFFIQVNVSAERQKNGCAESEVADLVAAIHRLHLSTQFMGFMGIAAPIDHVGESVVRAQFTKLRSLRDAWAPEAQLSMGMSDDFEIAIEEGSHWLRIGSAIFGAR